MRAGSGTALFAGVCKGAEEARKFMLKDRVNRVMLLSDGLANVGPSSPGELGEVGASLAREGLTVTTIGLGAGYNEDLMTQLAARSDGRHAFIERPSELAALFRDELGMMMAVVAQKVTIDIVCDPGVKPVRILGRPGIIAGQKVSLDLSQLYAGEEKYVLLEVEVPATSAELTRDLARVEVRYENLYTKAIETLKSAVSARFSHSAEEIERAINKEAMVATVTQIANAENERALNLRDAGRKEDAKAALLNNFRFLQDNGVQLRDSTLTRFAEINREDAFNLDSLDWGVARKQMKDIQYQNSLSQGKEFDKATKRRVSPAPAHPPIGNSLLGPARASFGTMRPRLLVALALLVLLPLVLLAWLGGRAARGEQARLRERFESLMTARLTEVKRGMAATIAVQERELTALLDSVMAPGQSLESQTPVHKPLRRRSRKPNLWRNKRRPPWPRERRRPAPSR